MQASRFECPSFDLDPLEYVALLQVVLDDHMVHGRLDDPNGAQN